MWLEGKVAQKCISMLLFGKFLKFKFGKINDCFKVAHFMGNLQHHFRMEEILIEKLSGKVFFTGVLYSERKYLSTLSQLRVVKYCLIVADSGCISKFENNPPFDMGDQCSGVFTFGLHAPHQLGNGITPSMI